MSEMTLSHFSGKESIQPYSVEQVTGKGWGPSGWGPKPKGLWVSVDGTDDWAEWCQSEDFGIGTNRYAVTLAADANVLHLTTVDEILAFNAEYGLGGYEVNWGRVAEKYQGIIIAPYQWSLRMSDVSWYYPWDCASGCIWDATAIESVTR